MKTTCTVLSILLFGLVLGSCGTVPESTSDTWETSPPVSMNARLEYQVDSLTNEVRRRDQQIEALATENRNLSTKSAELETRLNEMATKAEAPATPAPAPSMESSSEYEGALATFRMKDFAAAVQQFEALLNGGIRDDLADNCHYWMGESYYGMRRYKEAIDHFNMVLGYRKSEKKDDAQLMIANACWAMGDKAGAREAYNKLISSYPTSSLVPKAREKLVRLQ